MIKPVETCFWRAISVSRVTNSPVSRLLNEISYAICHHIVSEYNIICIYTCLSGRSAGVLTSLQIQIIGRRSCADPFLAFLPPEFAAGAAADSPLSPSSSSSSPP